MNAAEEALEDVQYNQLIAEFALGHAALQGKRRTTTSDNGTAGAATERQQHSTDNVCTPRPTAHDECDADTTTAGTRSRVDTMEDTAVDAVVA